VGVAFFTFIANRKHLKAQTADQLVTTAGGLADRADHRAERAEADRDKEYRRANREATKNRRWWERADEHSVWDREMKRLAVERGIDCPPMPPLYPKGSDADVE